MTRCMNNAKQQMTISDLSEQGLIAQLKKKFQSNEDSNIFGIGDDCAIIPLSQNKVQLISTDLLTEDVHFQLEKISAKQLAYKCLAVNLSDIHAMGGVAKYIFLSISLPKTLQLDWIEEFFDEIHNFCKQESLDLLGGDTTNSADKLTVNVTIIGSTNSDSVKMRSHAKPDDIVCVTGMLGDSAAGLKVLLEEIPRTSDTKRLIEQHLTPTVHSKAAQWLGRQASVNAMIDISDGLSQDLQHVLNASNCGANVFLEKLPISNELRQASETYGWSLEELSTSGGEDYCLLFTLAKDAFEKLAQELKQTFKLDAVSIGKITESAGNLTYFSHGKEKAVANKSFCHF